jgi:hypothetical protein
MATTRTYAVGQGGRVVRLDAHTGPWVDITPTFPNQNETTWFDVMSDPLDPDKVTIVGEDTLGSIGSGILVSTDAGTTWNIPGGNWTPGNNIHLKEVWYADSNVIWAVGLFGTVVQSLDAGLTFNIVARVNIGLDSETIAIHAIDAFTAVVGGAPIGGYGATRAYAWKTTDGGLTWNILNGGASLAAINPLNPVGSPGGIWISDDEQKIVVSTWNTQNVSTDGGLTFTSQPVEMTESGQHLTWYPAHDPNPATMRHTGGNLIHINESLDNGTTWATTRSGEGLAIPGAQFYTADDGYYIVNGTIFSTNDGGQTGISSYVEPLGLALWAVWTGSDITVEPGCPCYLATNCEDPTDSFPITIDCLTQAPLVPGTVYQFNIPGAGDDDRCWTIEEIDCPTTETISLNSGTIDAIGTLGAYDAQDFQWNVIGVPPSASPNASTPFPARISNQTWFGGYGTIPGAQWITMGQPNGSDTCPSGPGCAPGSYPHDASGGLVTYELQFTAPLGFIPLLNLTFLIDNNTTGITLNGNALSYTPPASPWVTPTLVTTNNPAFFNVGINTLRITVNNVGTGSNGFAMSGDIANASPPSTEIVVINEWIDCDDCLNPLVPNICWDLEVVCDGPCDDVYAINGFDFTPYIGQNITIQPPLTDPECWYTPYALRQAVFVAVPQSAGGGYNLSWPFGAFQQGTDDITFSIPSFILNGVEQIQGSPPTNLMTPANIQFVNCQQMTCTNVPLNNPGGLTGYSNMVDFINTVFASLGIMYMQAFNNSFDNCPITIIKPRETFRVQYRDGDTFTLQVTLSNIGQGVQTFTLQVAAGNVTTSFNVADPTTVFPTCNDNIWCLTDPADSPTITGATIMGDCPVEPIDLGESCEVVPRLGEPGFSVKNCDPKKVIDIKCKFADSVYAQFKRARYGIDTCCEFDLDKIDIKNQLIDLGTIYDPELCIDGTPLPDDCCLQPCNAVAELIVNLAVPCPAPTGPVVTDLTIPSPPFAACIEMEFSVEPVFGTISSIAGTGCCGTPFDISIQPGQLAPTLCVDANMPLTLSPNITSVILGDCDCCTAPTWINDAQFGRGVVSIN